MHLYRQGTQGFWLCRLHLMNEPFLQTSGAILGKLSSLSAFPPPPFLSPTPIHRLLAGSAAWLETGWINQQTGASLCCFCLILCSAGLCTVFLSLPLCSLIFGGQQQCKLLGNWCRDLAQMIFKQADLWIPHQGKCRKVSFFPLTFKFKMAFPVSLPNLHPAWCDGAWRALRFWGKSLWLDMKQWMMILAREWLGVGGDGERSSGLNCTFNPRTNRRAKHYFSCWLLLCCFFASWFKFVCFFYGLWSVAVEPFETCLAVHLLGCIIVLVPKVFS